MSRRRRSRRSSWRGWPSISIASSGGPTFDPLSVAPSGFWLSEPQYLFEEEDGTGTITATEAVGYNADISGTGLHLIHATAGNRPTYQTGGGLHWLQFDGVDDFLANATGVGAVADFTIVWAQRETTRQNGAAFSYSTDDAGNINRLIAHTPFGDGNFYVDAYSDLTDGRLTGVWPHAVDDDVVCSFRRSGASAVFRTNGVVRDTGSDGTAITSDIIVYGSLNNPLFRFAGRLYGMIFVPSAVGDGVLANLETYFGARAGLVL